VSENFGTIVVADFEYETSGGDYELRNGDLPVPLCMVAYVLDENLRHVHTIRRWRGEFGSAPPFDVGPDALFVAYSAWAEMTCFKVLGWPFPAHIFDQHTAYLATSNILLPYNPDEVRGKPRKRLPDACRAYGIEGWERIDKDTIAKDIGDGRWVDYGREQVLAYCEEDVRMSVRLLRAQLRGRPGVPRADVERVLHWSNYSAKCIALIQARGMPIDMTLWNLVQENKGAVIGELLRRFDPSHDSDDSIYTPEGEWSYQRFEQWLVRTGIAAWPRLDSGRLSVDSDAFRLMYHVPGIEGLHALRDSLGFIVKARLPIGCDGRNRPSLFPFGTATGRNAHTKSPYNAHAGMRSFMVFPHDAIGAYLDWRTQEVGVAAALSGDSALMDAYRAGDIYHALARVLGFTNDPDPMNWKKTNPAMRNRMKALQLAISYGMGVPSLARGLDRHPLIASEIIERHKRSYSRFWQWRADMVRTAMLERRIESIFGWPLHITTSPNQRTLYNFPMQSGGAEMLRLAAWRLCEAGIVPCMLVHDGILFEETDRERIEHAKEIMRQTGRDVCDGFEIDVDVDQMLIGGTRYCDKRPMAQKMWATIMDVLKAVGAVPKRAVA
jgi:DNA polymerase family A